MISGETIIWVVGLSFFIVYQIPSFINFNNYDKLTILQHKTYYIFEKNHAIVLPLNQHVISFYIVY